MELPDEPAPLPIGRAEVLREGGPVQFWALGDMLGIAERAADLLAAGGVTAGVVDARFVRPLDEDLLRRQAPRTRVIATLENGIVTGGFGSGVGERLAAMGFSGRILTFGWPDAFVPHGAPDLLRRQFGLVPERIAAAVRDVLAESG
jgi:1-deoxy-D-xylulose-5-phosphate synthase